MTSSGPVGPAPDALAPADREPATALRLLDLAELRAYRRALVEEVARVQRWQRVVRARTDLAVAAVLPPEPPAPLGPPGRLGPWVPRPAAACPEAEPVVTTPGCTVALTRLRQEARALHRYDDQVRELLAAATAELVERYAVTPAGALATGPLAG